MADSDAAPAAPDAMTPLAADPTSGLMQVGDTSAVQPAIDFAKNFYEGGLHQAFKGAGIQLPAWSQSISDFFTSPGVNTALGALTEFPKSPGWINTRLVTSKKALPTNEPQIVDMEALRQTPDLYAKNVDLLRDYPNTPTKVAKKSDDAVAEQFIEHVKGNLLFLHDQVPPDIRDRSSLWYEGGNKIVNDWAQQYGLKDSAVAGAIAALSPQKDWFQNVSMAGRVLDTLKGRGNNFYRGFALSPEMEETFARVGADKEDWGPMFEAIKGKSLADIDAMDKPADVKTGYKALWVRLHDQAHRVPDYPLVTPEGQFGDLVRNKSGTPAKAAWGSLTEIGKAINAIEANGDPAIMQVLMGEKHKVRNFYNNLLDPNGVMGDVTIDTHAVAAGLLRPLSQASIEVSHNFANYPGKGKAAAGGSAFTGVQGTYPLYAEAYRRAAAERGILPRQMQSITWEAARGLFPDTFKTAKNTQLIDSLWTKYRNGKATLDDTRNKVLDAAGGIRPPDWHRPEPGLQ
jgi:hypothetical protein